MEPISPASFHDMGEAFSNFQVVKSSNESGDILQSERCVVRIADCQFSYQI
jgi:hypothetical protein